MGKLNPDQLITLKALEQDSGDKLILKLNNLFETEARDGFMKMRTSLSAGEYTELSNHAHKLKSSCHNLGADEMALICKEIEIHARLDKNLDFLKMINTLEEGFPEIMAELRTYE